MPTYYLVCLIIVGVSIIFLSLYKKLFRKHPLETFLGGLTIFILAVSIIFGLGMVPILAKYKTINTKLTHYEVFIDNHVLILDASNSPEDKPEIFMKFYNHELVETYNDSIKFMVVTNRSFYGLMIDRKIGWSKPPYDWVYLY